MDSGGRIGFMRFREGRIGQKALFAALVGMYVLALALRLGTDAAGMGQPNPGFSFIYGAKTGLITGVGKAATDAGVLWGSELIGINGIPAAELPRTGDPDEEPAAFGINTQVGEANTIAFRHFLHSRGEVQTVTLQVQPRDWGDLLCMSGTPLILAGVFILVGIAGFLRTPYDHASWALLAFCTFFGGFITMVFRMTDYGPIAELYSQFMACTFVFAPIHLAMATVAPHPLLVRRPRLAFLIYVLAIPVFLLGAFANGSEAVPAAIMCVGTALCITRALVLAVWGPNRIVRQRARVVLIGCIGFIPPTVVWFAQTVTQSWMLDMRLVIVSVVTFPITLAYVSVRHDLFSAKIAIRRSAVYTLVAGVFVAGTVLITSLLTTSLGPESGYWVTPTVIALVLIPVLHYWPRIDEHLNNWLYPQRAHFPELRQTLGEQMAACTTTDAVLGILAVAPQKVCNATRGVAFLFPTAEDPDGHLGVMGPVQLDDVRALRDEPLMQLLLATRNQISRANISVETQFANIKSECYRTMDALGADLVLPIIRRNRVIGGLAVGPRDSGDVYDRAEIDVLSMLAQQAVQAIMRTEAFDKLQAKQEDIAHLKRYFPPHVIDEVVSKGGAAEFRSKRKPVTVFFSDLRGFTAFSDTVEPEEVMATLSEYHAAMGRRIEQFGGTLERFVGDGFMVFFNDPVAQDDHAQRAVRMAIAMRDDVRQLRENWVRKGYHLDVGMGIHTGFATCGVVGYEGRRDYSVIGNVTNLAARLCDAAAGGEVLVTARVISELGTAFANEPVGELTLKGFHQPQLTYRILGAETHV